MDVLSLHQFTFLIQEMELNAPFEAIIDMAISFTNKYLALFTESGVVWIGSADLKVRLGSSFTPDCF